MKICRSSAGCPRPAGHGRFGSFCAEHLAELDAVRESVNRLPGKTAVRPKPAPAAPPKRLPKRVRALRVARAVWDIEADHLPRDRAAEIAGVKPSALPPITGYAIDQQWIVGRRGVGGYVRGEIEPQPED